MVTSQIYIILAIVVLAIIFGVIFFINKNKKREKLSKLTLLAFGFIFAGIIFNESRLVSYSLMGIGIILAISDIILRKK